MAWFRNYYTCERCGESWDDEWSCTCDDDCPSCGARHFSPYHSDNISVVIEQMKDDRYAVLYSPPSAEQSPDYRRLAKVSGSRLAMMLETIAFNLTVDGYTMESKVVNAEGWLKDVYQCLLKIGKNEFNLSDVYAFEDELSKKYPHNNHIREKIRQQLQRLRDIDQIEFLGNGIYCLK